MFQTIHKYIKLKNLWNFSFENQKKKHAFDSFFQKKIEKEEVWVLINGVMRCPNPRLIVPNFVPK